jgi:hypothetical protein
MTQKVDPSTFDWPACWQHPGLNGAVDYHCSLCGTLLVHSKDGLLPGLLIICPQCAETSSTDGDAAPPR